MRTLLAFTVAVLSAALVRPALADRAPAGNTPRAVPLGPAPSTPPASPGASPAAPRAPAPAASSAAPGSEASPASPGAAAASPAAPGAAAPSASPAPRGASPIAATPLPVIDLSAVPEPCRPFVKPAQASNVASALSARISLATCMADRAVAPLELCDCAASVVAVDAAAAPALGLLDEVIDAGDPAAQILAEHAQGQLYAGFVRRLITTLPKISVGANEAEIALADMRRQTLDAQIAPWREAAATEFQRAIDIAKTHPELASNPAVASAVRDSEQRLASDVAAR